MAYSDFKDFPTRTAGDKELHDKVFNIARSPSYDGYQCVLVSIVYNFFDKKSSGSGVKSDIMLNQELGEELHKSNINKFEKRKV